MAKSLTGFFPKGDIFKMGNATPGCFGDYEIGQMTAERDCGSCPELHSCINKTSLRDKKKKEEAAKLDTGKPQLSLLSPTLVELMIPTAGTDQQRSARKAFMSLSKAAHADNIDRFVAHLNAAVSAMVSAAGSGPESLRLACIAMEYGAAKPEYGRNNWKKGMVWSRYLDAAMRHLLALLHGEETDKDSGNPHLAHAFGSMQMLFGNLELGVGTNNIF